MCRESVARDIGNCCFYGRFCERFYMNIRKLSRKMFTTSKVSAVGI